MSIANYRFYVESSFSKIYAKITSQYGHVTANTFDNIPRQNPQCFIAKL